MRDWHCEPLLRLTNYSIPPCVMAAMLEAGDCMAVSAATYGVCELQWEMELIVFDLIPTATLEVDDYIEISAAAYVFSEPKRGDLKH
jgi:hypothetical protein